MSIVKIFMVSPRFSQHKLNQYNFGNNVCSLTKTFFGKGKVHSALVESQIQNTCHILEHFVFSVEKVKAYNTNFKS